MAIISLPPVITGLLFTIINAVVELACLSAMFIFIALYECYRFSHGHTISIRHHCLIVKLVALFAMIMFISLEIAFSTNSNSFRRPQTHLEPCASSKFGLQDDPDSPESTAIAYKCVKVNGNVISFKTGNYSMKTKRIECNSDNIFLYRTGDLRRNISILNGTIGCLDEPVTPHGRKCATAYAQGQDLFISYTYLEKALDITEYTPNRTYFGTKLYIDPNGMLEKFAKLAVELSIRQVTDELNLRRQIFVGTTNSTCEFDGKVDELTNISNAVIGVILCFWVVSLSFFAIATLNKGKVFYDMRSARDWAQKTYHMVDSDRQEGMYITCVNVNGTRRMYISDHIEDDSLRVELGSKTVE